MQLRLSMFVFIALIAAACGGGESAPVVVDAAIDAAEPVDAPPSGPNALGQLCPVAAGGMGTACPAGNTCVAIMGLGSQTTGYCSPMCMNMTSICTTGYTGPAGGMPQCALGPPGGQPAACAIVCQQTSQCPTGLNCTPTGQQNISICVAP